MASNRANLAAGIVHVQSISKPSITSEKANNIHEQHGISGQMKFNDEHPANAVLSVVPSASPVAKKGSLRDRMKTPGMVKI